MRDYCKEISEPLHIKLGIIGQGDKYIALILSLKAINNLMVIDVNDLLGYT